MVDVLPVPPFAGPTVPVNKLVATLSAVNLTPPLLSCAVVIVAPVCPAISVIGVFYDSIYFGVSKCN